MNVHKVITRLMGNAKNVCPIAMTVILQMIARNARKTLFLFKIKTVEIVLPHVHHLNFFK